MRQSDEQSQSASHIVDTQERFLELKARGDRGFLLKHNFSVSPFVGADSVPSLLLARLCLSCCKWSRLHFSDLCGEFSRTSLSGRPGQSCMTSGHTLFKV